jgi:hypothetical protein
MKEPVQLTTVLLAIARKLKHPFTYKDVCKALPSMNKGTISGIISNMSGSGLLTMEPVNGSVGNRGLYTPAGSWTTASDPVAAAIVQRSTGARATSIDPDKNNMRPPFGRHRLVAFLHSRRRPVPAAIAGVRSRIATNIAAGMMNHLVTQGLLVLDPRGRYRKTANWSLDQALSPWGTTTPKLKAAKHIDGPKEAPYAAMHSMLERMEELERDSLTLQRIKSLLADAK